MNGEKRRYTWILIAMVLLTPLGMLAEGTAWGEWGGDELTETLGYVPQGIDRAASWWQALLPDYSIPLLGQSAAGHAAGYVLSAAGGALAVYLLMMLGLKCLTKGRTASGMRKG